MLSLEVHIQRNNMTLIPVTHCTSVLYYIRQGWPTATYSRATQLVKDSPEGRTFVYIYRKGRRGKDLINYKVVIYKQQVALKVRLNDKAVGRTEHGKTQRMFGLSCIVLKVMSYIAPKHFLCQ
jgi:hypothetical protein